MERWVMVMMVAAAFFVLTLSCAHLPPPADQQGFIVTIAADGKVKKAQNLDGSEVRYDPEEKKRLPGAHLAFFVEGKKEPDSFLKKKEGKWKKETLAKEGRTTTGAPGTADEIVVRVGPKGSIERVTNPDGTQPEYETPVDFSKARIVTVDNYCCWAPAGGARCLCAYCPWGCR